VSDFSACFLLIFGQMAVGGLFALAIPPFAVIERGFFKSTAAVFLGCALLFLAGRIDLLFRRSAPLGTPGTLAELAAWVGFVLALARYLWTLWGDAGARVARAYLTALGLGTAALIATALVHRPALLPGAGHLLYVPAFLTGALTLGAVATGLSLGHWYLIDLGLSIAPLKRLFRFFIGCVLAHLTVLVITAGLTALLSPAGGAALTALWHDHRPLVATRLIFGPLAALGLGYLIHRTLEIPQTMAATGLFYIAILAVMVGELLGRLILFRTALPL
jgi:hypothetical protein